MDNNTATYTSKNESTYGLTESTENYTSSYFNYNTRLTYTEEDTATPTPQPNSSNGSIVCVAIVTAVVSLAALVIGIALLFLRRKNHRHGREKFKSYIKCSEDVSDELLDDVFYSNGTEMDLITDVNDKETATITTTEDMDMNGKIDASCSNHGKSRTNTPDSNETTSIQTTVLITPERQDESNNESRRLSGQGSQVPRCNSSVGSNSDQQTHDGNSILDNLDIEKTIATESVSEKGEIIQS